MLGHGLGIHAGVPAQAEDEHAIEVGRFQLVKEEAVAGQAIGLLLLAGEGEGAQDIGAHLQGDDLVGA